MNIVTLEEGMPLQVYVEVRSATVVDCKAVDEQQNFQDTHKLEHGSILLVQRALSRVRCDEHMSHAPRHVYMTILPKSHHVCMLTGNCTLIDVLPPNTVDMILFPKLCACITMQEDAMLFQYPTVKSFLRQFRKG